MDFAIIFAIVQSLVEVVVILGGVYYIVCKVIYEHEVSMNRQIALLGDEVRGQRDKGNFQTPRQRM